MALTVIHRGNESRHGDDRPGFALLGRAGIVYRDERARCIMLIVQNRWHGLLTHIRVTSKASQQSAFAWGAKVKHALGYIMVRGPDRRWKGLNVRQLCSRRTRMRPVTSGERIDNPINYTTVEALA
jgi:hypothetical protein